MLPFGGKSKRVATFTATYSVGASEGGSEEGDGEGNLKYRGNGIGVNVSSPKHMGGYKSGSGGIRSGSFGLGHLEA